MSKLSIEIDVPEGAGGKELEAKVAATAARVVLEQTILRLYQTNDVSTETGAHMLGMNVHDFIMFLGEHKVSVFHYGEGELEAELQSARQQSR